MGRRTSSPPLRTTARAEQRRSVSSGRQVVSVTDFVHGGERQPYKRFKSNAGTNPLYASTHSAGRTVGSFALGGEAGGSAGDDAGASDFLTRLTGRKRTVAAPTREEVQRRRIVKAVPEPDRTGHAKGKKHDPRTYDDHLAEFLLKGPAPAPSQQSQTPYVAPKVPWGNPSSSEQLGVDVPISGRRHATAGRPSGCISTLWKPSTEAAPATASVAANGADTPPGASLSRAASYREAKAASARIFAPPDGSTPSDSVVRRGMKRVAAPGQKQDLEEMMPTGVSSHHTSAARSGRRRRSSVHGGYGADPTPDGVRPAGQRTLTDDEKRELIRRRCRSAPAHRDAPYDATTNQESYDITLDSAQVSSAAIETRRSGPRWGARDDVALDDTCRSFQGMAAGPGEHEFKPARKDRNGTALWDVMHHTPTNDAVVAQAGPTESQQRRSLSATRRSRIREQLDVAPKVTDRAPLLASEVAPRMCRNEPMGGSGVPAPRGKMRTRSSEAGLRGTFSLAHEG